MASKAAKKKMCFVVGPIGDDDSEDRIHADWLLEDIITPVFEEHFKEFDVTRADKISNPGQITSQVITSLLDAELVIADLTTLNPNAFYEIGIRHTIQKPIIHMHLEGQRIPFDIAPFRSIKFSRRKPADIRAARAALLAAVVEATKEDHEVDNPVTFSRGKVEFEKSATPAEKVMQEQMESINARLALLERADNPVAMFSSGVVEALRRPPQKPTRWAGGSAMTYHFSRDEIAIKVLSDIQSAAHLLADARRAMETHFESFSTLEENPAFVLYSVSFNDRNWKAANAVAETLRGMEYRVDISAARAPK
ncbi:hypothetical protein [Rhizobium sp. Nf11,1]|uniref:hypothetical protein n=1 Tax=Rhizobium sp. Nf11,1 TaxID=3404923 RepID=UPI003D33A467